MQLDWTKERVLVVAPHVDDEVSCAGTISLAIRGGATVRVLALSLCEESLPEGFEISDIKLEYAKSIEVLGVQESGIRDFPVRRFDSHRQGILETLVLVRKSFDPTLVLCPSSTDSHQDHRVVHEECERLFRDTTILGYVNPLNMRSIPRLLYFRLEPEDIEAKLSAWRCYDSQIAKEVSVLRERWINLLCRMWGEMSRSRGGVAEAFEFIGGVCG